MDNALAEKGQLEKIIDPHLVEMINPGSMKKFGENAEKCLEEQGIDKAWGSYRKVLGTVGNQQACHGRPSMESGTCISILGNNHSKRSS